MPTQGVLEIVACELRPEGSFGHLAVLVAFVFAAARLAPASGRPIRRAIRRPGRGPIRPTSARR